MHEIGPSFDKPVKYELSIKDEWQLVVLASSKSYDSVEKSKLD